MIKDSNKSALAQTISVIWECLTDSQRDDFAAQAELEVYKDKDIIFSEGEEPLYFMYLHKGHVAMQGKGVGGYSQIIRMVEPGSIFGYREAFCNQPYASTAIAGADTHIIKVPFEVIFHLTWENQQISRLFIHELATLLGLSVRRTINLTQKHIRGRLAEILLRLKEKYGTEADGQTLAIYLSRYNLASMSNMTTSNAIRTLSSFADEQLVALKGKKIKILNEEKLHRISELG